MTAGLTDKPPTEAPAVGLFSRLAPLGSERGDVGIGSQTVTRLSPAQARKKHLQR